MSREELIDKLHMVAIGDINALTEMEGYYDGLKQGIKQLQQQNQKQKEVIDKAIEHIKKANYGNIYEIKGSKWYELLEILKGEDNE